MRIDVVMLTNNSNKPYFRRVLNAIKREIPVHHFIVVDNYSTDGTLDVVKQYFKDVLLVIRTRGSLGYSRYVGMKLVDTEYFAFIDSDVEILSGWFNAAERFMIRYHGKVLGIQGVFVQINKKIGGKRSKVIELIRPLKDIPLKTLLLRGFYKWGGADSGHVIFHRSVIDLVNPCVLTQLHAGEDLYIAQTIVEKGFKYVRVPEMRAIHYGTYTVTKAVKRLTSANGLYLYLSLPAISSYYLARITISLTKSREEILLHVIGLLSSPIAYNKTRQIT